MKSIIYISLFLFIFTIGCDDDFLVKAPHTSMAEDAFYSTSDQALMAVNAVYRSLTQIHSNEGYDMMHLAPTDDVNLAPSLQGALLNSFTISADYFVLENAYTSLYQGVSRANAAIERIPDVDMNEGLKTRLIGEAKFLRAFFYFELMKMWGEVPLIKEVLVTPEDALKPKASQDEIRTAIVDDLVDAIDVLPDVTEYPDSEIGRATVGAAKSLLGKVYLYAEDYVNAEKWLKEVIDSGSYSLVDEFELVVNRNNPNNEESIFEVQYQQGIVTSSKDGRFLPRGHFGSGYYLVLQDLVDAYEEDDPRLSYSIFRDGDVFAPLVGDPNEEFFQSEWSLTGYSIKKGIQPIQSPRVNETNWPIIRYADVLLMYAEAANELDLIDEAREAVNQVRQRSSVDMPPLTATQTNTKQAMFEAIVHERRVELAFEFHRYHDLKRWGLAEEYLGDMGYTSQYRYYPLPQVELDTNPNLVQTSTWQ